MGEIQDINYTAFSAGYTAGEYMTIIDDDTPFEDIVSWVFDSRSLWYYDGTKYRIVIHFEALEDAAVIYYFSDSGEILGKQFGGDS